MFFTEKDRQIFSYKLMDGTERKADPLKIYRQFRALSKGELASWIRDLSHQQDPVIISNLMRDVASIVRYSFDGKEFDPVTGEGWTEGFCIKLAIEFYIWKGELKKNGEMNVTTPSPTGLVDGNPTNTGSPSGVCEVGPVS